jgi:hypothetical protein
MELDEPSCCPSWFPLFLLGMGLTNLLACRLLG